MLNKIYPSLQRGVPILARPAVPQVFDLGGFFGGLFNSGASVINNERQIKAQKESQESQNAWQESENQRDRLWQEQQWLSQFDKQNEENDRRFQMENEEFDRRFNQQNEYNDPSAVVARLQSAGINPAAALNQLSGSGGLAAAGGSSSPQMPNASVPQTMGAHSVSPIGVSNPNNIINVGGLMSGIADLMNAKTNAGRLGLDTKYQEATLNSVIKQMESNAAYNDSLTALNRIQEEVDKVFKKPQAAAQFMQTINYASLLALQGKTEEADAALKDEMKRLTKLRGDIYEEGKAGLLNLIGSYNVSLKGAAAASFAAAENQRAQAETENLLRPDRKLSAEFKSKLDIINEKMAVLDWTKRDAKFEQEIEAYGWELYRSQVLTEEAQQRLYGLLKDNSWKDVANFMKTINSASDSFMKVGIGVNSIVKPW